MQFLFSPVLGALSDRFGRRPVVLLSNFGLAADYVLMALAPSLAWLFVGRRDLRHHLGQHLDRVCLYRRHHAAGEARRRCSARSASPSARASSSAPRWAACSAIYRSAAAVLGRGGLEPCQRALWPVHPAGVAAERAPRAVPLEERQSASACCICCAPAAFLPGCGRQFLRAARACRAAVDLRALCDLSLRLGRARRSA